jgi:hypothetical protein
MPIYTGASLEANAKNAIPFADGIFPYNQSEITGTGFPSSEAMRRLSANLAILGRRQASMLG